LTKIILGGSWK